MECPCPECGKPLRIESIRMDRGRLAYWLRCYGCEADDPQDPATPGEPPSQIYTVTMAWSERAMASARSFEPILDAHFARVKQQVMAEHQRLVTEKNGRH